MERIAERRPGRRLPGGVREALVRRLGAWTDGPVLERLSPNSPTYRLSSPEGSWIVRRPGDPEREVVAARVCRELGIPSYAVERLGGGWLLLEDLAGDRLVDRLRADGPPSPAAIEGLGALARQADLLGMRDRRTDNVICRGRLDGDELELRHVDYEGAFRAGLLTRVLLRHRALAHLVRRLLVEVLRLAGADPGPAVPDAAWAPFRQGFLAEARRLAGRTVRFLPARGEPGIRARVILGTRVRSVRRLAGLLERARRRTDRRLARGAW